MIFRMLLVYKNWGGVGGEFDILEKLENNFILIFGSCYKLKNEVKN